MLLDAANEHEQLLELCTALGVRRVLETHGHWDHIQAVPAMREAGYEVAVTALDAPKLKDVGYDVFIDDAEVIEVGRLRLHAIHNPGHTPGSISFQLEGTPLLFTGDTLFPGGPGNTSFPDADFDTIITRSRRSSSRSPTTRSSCPATATTPRSAPNAPTSRSGSNAGGEPSTVMPALAGTSSVGDLQWAISAISSLDTSPGSLPMMIMASTSSLVTSSLFDRADELALQHHADPVGEIEHVVDVVADQEDPDALGLQLRDEVAHLSGLGRSERRRGLVHDEDPGVEVDGPGDGHRLALTTRQ